jgi:hypothetical protein
LGGTVAQKLILVVGLIRGVVAAYVAWLPSKVIRWRAGKRPHAVIISM